MGILGKATALLQQCLTLRDQEQAGTISLGMVYYAKADLNKLRDTIHTHAPHYEEEEEAEGMVNPETGTWTLQTTGTFDHEGPIRRQIRQRTIAAMDAIVQHLNILLASLGSGG